MDGEFFKLLFYDEELRGKFKEGREKNREKKIK